MTPKVKVSKMSFRIPRLWIITPKKLRLCGTRLCPHFAQNRPKSENLATFMPRSSATVRRREKLTDLGKSLALALQRGVKSISLHASHDRSRPKFPECCHPLTCPRILNLVRIGCALPDLFRKDWFFGPKSNYNIGFQPTMTFNESLNWKEVTLYDMIVTQTYISVQSDWK